MKKQAIPFLVFVFIFLINQTYSSAQEKIKILSYNVLYGLQKDSVANIDRYVSLLNELDPDIVATQEMNGWTQKTLENLARRYQHPYALQSKEDGFPTAITSKYPLVNFKKVTENMWHSYVYAKVKGIHIFVIHFSPFSYQKRLEEVAHIIAQAQEIPKKEPILIMGDFNSMSDEDASQYGDEVLKAMIAQEEKHSHIRNLNEGKIDYTVINSLKKAGFKDTFTLMGNGFESSIPSFKSGESKIKTTNSGNGKRIDFLFCNEYAAPLIKKSVIVKNEKTHIISDHYPVYVELELKK
ncbi:endonuclease/exonuclease/phosphatase family protein [Sphingobacterium sp. HJSM2_6]|uniref:endonuclease/exonuclease/phosphatase family protein n=1 Tax=Sphingobacterium sp. HJSM2_6 TaxID=3366264 RepID=UPI003BCBC780